jgi:3-deoxy-D-manno-octulosonate 8-phosphate phosphatase (KDO 8-P phosphatase)
LARGTGTRSKATLSRAELVARARRLRLVLTDNDGVLTDAGVYYSERGEELKRYSVRDGMGVERLRLAGIETAIVTREAGGCVRGRAEKLNVRFYTGVKDKVAFLPTLLADHGFEVDQLGFIGDDVNDLELMETVGRGGLTGTPSDAMPVVSRIALHRCSAAGGHGAFRDFADWILELRS